jgi:hypothetical protein
MQYPHTWIVWVYAQSVHSHITIQEMSAVRLPSCTENFHIFFEGLRKHFLYMSAIRHKMPFSIANLKNYSQTHNTQRGYCTEKIFFILFY